MLTTLAGAMALAMAMLPIAADAQGRGRGGRGSIPPGHLPPPGECRVWYDDRPPGHQSPPTSCAEARLEAYRTGGRVIYGGSEGRDKRGDRRDRDDDRRDRDRDRDSCIDIDRDGRCDFGTDDRRNPRDRYPDDRYPDGRRRYPETLPETVWGVIVGRGDRLAVSGVREWLGRNDVSPRHTDADRDGQPEAVNWYDARGTLLQRWVDANRDGRADRVTIYENGRAVRTIR